MARPPRLQRLDPAAVPLATRRVAAPARGAQRGRRGWSLLDGRSPRLQHQAVPGPPRKAPCRASRCAPRVPLPVACAESRRAPGRFDGRPAGCQVEVPRVAPVPQVLPCAVAAPPALPGALSGSAWQGAALSSRDSLRSTRASWRGFAASAGNPARHAPGPRSARCQRLGRRPRRGGLGRVRRSDPAAHRPDADRRVGFQVPLRLLQVRPKQASLRSGWGEAPPKHTVPAGGPSSGPRAARSPSAAPERVGRLVLWCRQASLMQARLALSMGGSAAFPAGQGPPQRVRVARQRLRLRRRP